FKKLAGFSLNNNATFVHSLSINIVYKLYGYC
ncbi:MAG: hypothetical protein ACI8WW_001069, partial [Oceanospirillaceae bacterium]